ncbi:MAG: DUF366 family protein [Methanobrevibacter sp.]|jgi:hypothetical protein|nr:DUF366 family protein [Methanobrevibacter sp.]
MEIIHKHLEESLNYDGSQIEASWAFREYGIKGSAIITWIGPMNIIPDNLKDFEDIGLEIKSDKMAHFIIEHFDEQPANLRIAYLRQRILVMILKEELDKLSIKSIRKGDDLFINSRKLTVSIATASLSSMKIHLGINITSDGTPDDVDTIGLSELNSEFNINNINSTDNINNINNNDSANSTNSTNNTNNITKNTNKNTNNNTNNNLNINSNSSINSNINNNANNNTNNSSNDFNILNFINKIVNNYINELKDIELDISKTNLL